MQLRHAHIPDPADQSRTSAETLLEMIDAGRPAWHQRAACRGQQDVMFPTSTLGRRNDYTTALSLCMSCPVRTQCAEAGRNEHDGVWGGEVKDRNSKRNSSARAMTDVLAWLRANPGWHSTTEVAREVGFRRNTISMCLSQCVESGLVEYRAGVHGSSKNPPTYRATDQ